MLLNWYYTNLLFGDLSFLMMLKIVFFYGLWLTFVLTISIFYNTIFKLPGLVGACTIITIILMSLINKIIGHKLTLFPNQLSAHIYEMMETNTVSSELIGTSVIVCILIAIILLVAIFIFKYKEMVN